MEANLALFSATQCLCSEHEHNRHGGKDDTTHGPHRMDSLSLKLIHQTSSNAECHTLHQRQRPVLKPQFGRSVTDW